jgi:hypothetical protein
MRTITFAALLAACDTAGARPYSPPPFAPVPEDSTGASTGDLARLDLGTHEPIPDLPAETGSTGEPGTPTTGAGEGSSGDSTSTGEDSSSGSSGSSSTSTGDPGTSTGSSSTGEPAVCGDGVCEPSERAACWAWSGGWTDGFCWPDCGEHPECLAEVDCACTPGAAAVKNFCTADPPVVCAATMPGGLCSQPGGDAPVFYMWLSKCG